MSSKFLKRKLPRLILRKFILFNMGILLGTLFAHLVQFCLIRDAGLSVKAQNLIFNGIIACIVVGFLLTNLIPCIAMLTILEFGSNSGRKCAQGVVVILVLAGPVKNMSKNADSVIRVMTCFTELAWNITMIRKDILFLPLHHITSVLTGEIKKEQDKIEAKGVERLWKPLEEELDGEGEIMALKNVHNKEVDQFSSIVDDKYRVNSNDSEAKKIEKSFSKALSYKCEGIFYNASGSCRVAFQDLYDNCYDTVTDVLGWALCWPMDLQHVCNFISMFEKEDEEACIEVPEDKILPKDFGEQVLSVKSGVLDIPTNFSRLITNVFSVMNNLDEIGAKEIEEKKDLVQENFNRWEKIIQKTLIWVQKGFGFYCFFVIFKAMKYHRKYLSRISYDNKYITKYFQRIDDRRVIQGRSNLLPLKNFEKSDYITVIKLTLTAEERIVIIPRIFSLGVMSTILGTIFVLDRIISQLLHIFRRDEDFLIHVKGDYVVDVHIEGKGTLAEILRTLVKEISVNYNVHQIRETKPCLPTIHKLPFVYYASTVALIVVIFLLCFLEALSRRARHLITDNFYQVRAKRRTLWLYNECLRRRATQMEIIKRKLMQNAYSFRISDDYKVLKTIREICPRLWNFIKAFHVDFRQCLLCQSKGELYHCPKCSFFFCYKCLEDMDGVCLYCQARKEMLEMMEENSDDEESILYLSTFN